MPATGWEVQAGGGGEGRLAGRFSRRLICIGARRGRGPRRHKAAAARPGVLFAFGSISARSPCSGGGVGCSLTCLLCLPREGALRLRPPPSQPASQPPAPPGLAMAVEKEKKSCGQVMHEWKEFVWNPRTHQFMGRTGSSWGEAWRRRAGGVRKTQGLWPPPTPTPHPSPSGWEKLAPELSIGVRGGSPFPRGACTPTPSCNGGGGARKAGGLRERALPCPPPGGGALQSLARNGSRRLRLMAMEATGRRGGGGLKGSSLSGGVSNEGRGRPRSSRVGRGGFSFPPLPSDSPIFPPPLIWTGRGVLKEAPFPGGSQTRGRGVLDSPGRGRGGFSFPLPSDSPPLSSPPPLISTGEGGQERTQAPPVMPTKAKAGGRRSRHPPSTPTPAPIPPVLASLPADRASPDAGWEMRGCAVGAGAECVSLCVRVCVGGM
ncbi:sodium/potassium-transporting ATPase subunit beta-2-like [Crotalus adamanteus]|uniref:Sodium/potassium-transporting ATPase subunit beta-2-like n=1 Tax=Crotalus adamanteus TaxID=8729 RepID=A0AAW1B9V5_CROAD